MGIAPYLAEAIVREHKYRPITGNILLLGHQTMFFSPQDAVDMIRRNGVEPAAIPLDELEIDRQTLASKDHAYIRDVAFFRLLGIEKIQALDHTDYEGAEIIHDLNLPIPKDLEGIADFILDGSTLDNVWDVPTTVRNVARLLRPGGRFLSINMGSNHYTPYTILTPLWLLDYFVVNNFADCKPYMVIHDQISGIAFFTPEVRQLLGVGSAALPNIASPLVMGVVMFAEKGEGSTWDKIPVQQAYRPTEAVLPYKASIDRMIAMGRPHPVRSTAPFAVNANIDGWLLVTESGEAVPFVVPVVVPANIRVRRPLVDYTSREFGLFFARRLRRLIKV